MLSSGWKNHNFLSWMPIRPSGSILAIIATLLWYSWISKQGSSSRPEKMLAFTHNHQSRPSPKKSSPGGNVQCISMPIYLTKLLGLKIFSRYQMCFHLPILPDFSLWKLCRGLEGRECGCGLVAVYLPLFHQNLSLQKKIKYPRQLKIVTVKYLFSSNFLLRYL